MNRPDIGGLSSLIEKELPVLDHGFIRVVDAMGNDEAIEQAARVSYGTGTTGKRDLGGLIDYLMEHWHTTPFEMCEIKLHVKLPLFVARQWVRHRMASINEYSARYSVLDNEFHIPELPQLQPQSGTNGQGRNGDEHELSQSFKRTLEVHSGTCYEIYDALLMRDSDGNDQGLARELSRMVLPTNVYTQWYWKVDLHNLFNFLRLRADPHAQYEIRQYAEVMCSIAELWVPLAYASWVNHRRDAVTFSASEMEHLRRAVRGNLPFDTTSASNLKARQVAALNTKLGLD